MEIVNISKIKYFDNKFFLCFQSEKIIINKQTIVFKLLFKGKKKLKTKARKDRKINPFKKVLQKKEKFKIIFFSKIVPVK